MEPTNPLNHPITVGTCIAATAASGWWWLGNDVSPLLMAPSAVGPEPWRLLTSTLLHVNFIHLLFNGLWMFRFGTLLEGQLGALRFGGLFVLLAVGSGAAEQALAGGGVGLSGVVYGLFGFLWAARRAGQRYALAVVDQRTTALFVGWFFFCIVATYTGMLAIANVAHGMGALLGFLLGLAAARPRARIAAGLGAGLLVALSLLGAGPLRPTVNLVGAAPVVLDATKADAALEAGNDEEARSLYRSALEQTPDDWRLWHNLTIAHQRLAQHEDAVESAKRAHELEASEKTRRLLGDAYERLGDQHLQGGRHREALEPLREAASLVPDEESYHERLAWCLDALGRPGEAEAARAAARESRSRGAR